MGYSFFKQASTPNNDWRLVGNQMSKYIEPDGVTEPGQEQVLTITEFNSDDFESFIETFEIEGKTIKWILEHQREWKYLCPSAHLEKHRYEQFCFTYKGKKYMFYYSGNDGIPGRSIGFCIDAIDAMISVGPLETWAELPHKMYIDGKSLAELFDTEYDDGPILKAHYNGWFWEVNEDCTDWWWTS